MSKLEGVEWLQSPEKRRMDLAFGVPLLLATTPLVVIASAAVECIDEVPAEHSQVRLGRGMLPFTIHKITTMPGELNVPATSSKGGWRDPRASATGSFLRRFGIDELPQFRSVVRGDMSIVGPRPLVPSEYEEIMNRLSPKEQLEWRWALDIMRPGFIDAFGIYAHQHSYEVDTIERVGYNIEYAATASRSGDVDLVREALAILMPTGDAISPVPLTPATEQEVA